MSEPAADDHMHNSLSSEVEELRRKLHEFQVALKDSEEINRLSIEQQRVLKEEIRELERAEKREGANLLYVQHWRGRGHDGSEGSWSYRDWRKWEGRSGMQQAVTLS